jgi:hypothetical protein
LAFIPPVTVQLEGTTFTVNVAGFVVVHPNALANTASNFVPLCPTLVAGVAYEVEVAPLIGENPL